MGLRQQLWLRHDMTFRNHEKSRTKFTVSLSRNRNLHYISILFLFLYIFEYLWTSVVMNTVNNNQNVSASPAFNVQLFIHRHGLCKVQYLSGIEIHWNELSLIAWIIKIAPAYYHAYIMECKNFLFKSLNLEDPKKFIRHACW